MKKSLYTAAYKVASALSNLTGGATPVARWKVALGIAVLGLSAGAMTGCELHTECYAPVPPPDVMCYDPAVPPETDPGQDDNGNGDDQGDGQGQGQTQGGDDGVMCYAPALPPEN